MPVIEFVDDGMNEEVEAGRLLQDVIDDCGADIIFGCREGGCATCLIHVLSGMEHLSPISDAEYSTLEDNELEQGMRLACQITITGDGHVALRAAGL